MPKYIVKGVMTLKSGDQVSFEEEYASAVRASHAAEKAKALGYTVIIYTEDTTDETTR